MNSNSLLAIPIQPKTSLGEYTLVVVLNASTLDSVQKHNVIDLKLEDLGEPWVHMKVSRFIHCFESDDSFPVMMDMIAGKRIKELISFLNRGHTPGLSETIMLTEPSEEDIAEMAVATKH